MASETVIFLTGAPDADSPTWDDDELPSHFTIRHRRYLQHGDWDETTQDSLAQATQSLARWREVGIHAQPLQYSRDHNGTRAMPEATQFLSFQDGPSRKEAEHRDFLERSLYALQNLESSQIGIPEDTTYVTAASFSTTLSTNLSLQTSRDSYASGASEDPQQMVPFNGLITDLIHIPNARYLESIQPQTMTINILAGVIAVQPTRTVRLKKRAGEKDIVEVILGDETKAGFGIQFWLSPIDSQAHRSSATKGQLRDVLQDLRPGYTVLVTYIALDHFKNNVFGQSLSKRITRNNTSITILSQNITGLPAPTMAKLDRVGEWSRNFVGKKESKRIASPELVSGGSCRKKAKRILPPDTQPGEL